MDRDEDILLATWREASQHLEIRECAEHVAPLLVPRMPVDRILVRRFDFERHTIETVAAVADGEDAATVSQRSRIAPGELDALVAWARPGAVHHVDARELRLSLPNLLPTGVEGDVVAGVLHAGERASGVIFLVAKPPRRFEGDDVRLVATLLDPLSVALGNDQRFHEMQMVKDAAEAERQALLSRLGRREIVEAIIGADTGLREVLDRVDRVASLDVPVLILGETGSGKEVVARAIHTRSRRATGPFLRVNCGAIPSGLIDSELFGHERGSFTGAHGERKGWFERADRGTLFLDEVGELPLDAQVRLLRVLQDGTLERVGGNRSITVDVRIVAATHRNLQAMIATGEFREDLWYRIAVFPIDLPPLRERLHDVPDLARHFALRAAYRFGRPLVVPSDSDIEQLMRHAWPGNVRELGTVIERAVILGDGRRLDVAQALAAAAIAPTRPVDGREAVGSGRSSVAPSSRGPISSDEPFPTLDDAVRRHIEAALVQTRGCIEGPYGAAALLGLNPHTLRGRMRKLGVDWKRFRPAPSASRPAEPVGPAPRAIALHD
ncbi:MAG: sigma-54-dependent Fis family transcriptional regulator [Myxococcota bacterium]